MKSTGIVRKVDELGRLLFYRASQNLDIEEKMPGIYVDGNILF